MDEDQILQSIIADPQLTDPSIDVGQLRQTTPTRTELLADVPEFSGLKFDPTQRSYIEDLYTLYGGGLPTISEPVVETPVVTTPVVDTLVDVGGGGGGMDQVTGDSVLDTPTDGGLTESGTFGGQPTFTTTPGTTVDNVTGDITNPDGSFGGNIVDEVALTGGTTTPVDTSIAIEDLTQPSNIGDFQITTAPDLPNQTGVIEDIPISPVTTSIDAQGNIFDAQTEQYLGNKFDEVALTGTGTPEQQEGFLQNVLGKAGQTVDNALNELGKVPGAVVDFANQTVDIFGQKLNVGRTLATAAVNRVVGAPISLVFDLLQAAGLEGGRGEFANELGNIYGMDDIGRLTSGPMAGYAPNSFGGDIVQAAQERIDNIENRAAPQTDFSIKKVQELNDFIQKATSIKAKQAAPQENIGSVPGGEGALDETSTAEEIAQDFASKQAQAELRGGNIVDEFKSSDIQATDPTLDIPDRGRGDVQDTTDIDPADDFEVSGDVANVGTAMDLIGPAPTSQDIPDRGRGDTSGSGQISDAQAAANRDAARGQTGGGSSDSGGKGIVCTMMNDFYGFGSFRNKIWLKHSKSLAPEYQKGYHKIFLPLVAYARKDGVTNKIVRKTLEHIAVHRTIDIRQESRGKVHLLGRVYRKILEPICYWVGKYD